jgi:hypothetical protein
LHRQADEFDGDSRTVLVMRFPTLALLIALAVHVSAVGAWKIEKDEPLVVDLGVAQDIRWASDTQVFIAEGRNGVTVRRIDVPGTVEGYAILPAKKGGYFFSSRMAASPGFVAVASPLSSFSWRARKADATLHQPIPIGMVMDLDVHGDRIAVLGGDTDQKGGTPDGIVSVASLSRNVNDRTILLEGPTGKAGKELARCHFFETGAIRFLEDGSLVVVPGLEPGIFQFSPTGKLLRTWQTDGLNVLDDCRINDEQMVDMAADFAKRAEWVSRYTTVEDILPFSDGPALLLRTVRNNATTWEVAYLRDGGKITREPLQIRSPNPRAHLRGDVRGKRVALLLFDHELPGNQPLAPRLILATR